MQIIVQQNHQNSTTPSLHCLLCSPKFLSYAGSAQCLGSLSEQASRTHTRKTFEQYFPSLDQGNGEHKLRCSDFILVSFHFHLLPDTTHPALPTHRCRLAPLAARFVFSPMKVVGSGWMATRDALVEARVYAVSVFCLKIWMGIPIASRATPRPRLTRTHEQTS